MATYRTSDLLNLLGQLSNDGYDYVEISENDAYEDPTSMELEAVIDRSASEFFGAINSCDVPEDYIYGYSHSLIQPSDICSGISFTFDELFTLMNAVDNALEYCKERLARPACTRDERDAIKSNAPEFRNMQAKFAKLRKKYGITVKN